MDRHKVVKYLREHSELRGHSIPDVIRALKSAGLIAPTTYWRDCRSIPGLLKTALRRKAEAQSL